MALAPASLNVSYTVKEFYRIGTKEGVMANGGLGTGQDQLLLFLGDSLVKSAPETTSKPTPKSAAAPESAPKATPEISTKVSPEPLVTAVPVAMISSVAMVIPAMAMFIPTSVTAMPVAVSSVVFVDAFLLRDLLRDLKSFDAGVSFSQKES